MRPELFRLFTATFASVFVAELGDKTQLATLALSSGTDAARARWIVFAGAASALVLASALGVLAGAALGRFVSERVLRAVGGVGFLAMGGWMLFGKG